jgi:hypothetical protein
MKTTFDIESLDITFLKGGRKVRINTEYHFLLDDVEYIIPAGWISDGASIPRLLWPVLGSPFVGKHRAGCILHDFLYWKNVESQNYSDLCMYHKNRLDGVGWIKANLLYTGLCIGGWVAWNNHSKRIAMEKNNEI